MNDALDVRGGEALRGRDADVERRALRRETARRTEPGDPASRRDAVHELHHDVVRAGDLVAVHAEDLHEVVGLEAPRQPRLALEALEMDLLLGLRDRAHDLDGDLGPAARVDPVVDEAHAALAQPREQGDAAERRTECALELYLSAALERPVAGDVLRRTRPRTSPAAFARSPHFDALSVPSAVELRT